MILNLHKNNINNMNNNIKNLQENFKLLVNYNTKLTLTENKKLNEDAIGKEIYSLSRDGKLVISNVAKNWLKELKSVRSTGKDFVSFLKGWGGLSKDTKNAFVKELLTDTSVMRSEVMADATVTALINKASESLSKQLASNGTKLAKEFNALKNNPQKRQFLKKNNYRTDVIDYILKDEKLVAKDFNSVSNKSNKIVSSADDIGTKSKSPFLDDVGAESKSPFLDDVGAESKLSTNAEIEEFIKNSKEEMKYYEQGLLDDIKKNKLVKKGLLKRVGGLGRKVKWVISKRKLAIWAAALSISIYALKNWLSDNDIEVIETPPVETVGNVNVNPVVNTTSSGGQGNVNPTTTTTTTYKYDGKYAYNDDINN